jgi:hypothetical protein
LLEQSINGVCASQKENKMLEQAKGILKAMITVALGVTAGLMIHEQVTKIAAKKEA